MIWVFSQPPFGDQDEYMERVTLFCTHGFLAARKVYNGTAVNKKKLGYNFNATEGIEPSITRPGSLDVFYRVTLHGWRSDRKILESSPNL